MQTIVERSSRNRLARTASSRLVLVAAMMRTSTVMERCRQRVERVPGVPAQFDLRGRTNIADFIEKECHDAPFQNDHGASLWPR